MPRLMCVGFPQTRPILACSRTLVSYPLFAPHPHSPLGGQDKILHLQLDAGWSLHLLCGYQVYVLPDRESKDAKEAFGTVCPCKIIILYKLQSSTQVMAAVR